MSRQYNILIKQTQHISFCYAYITMYTFNIKYHTHTIIEQSNSVNKQRQQSQSSQSSQFSQSSMNTNANTNTNTKKNIENILGSQNSYINPNINSNSKSNSNSNKNGGISTQDQLDLLTDENMMPFQRYKKVEQYNYKKTHGESPQLRKDNQNSNKVDTGHKEINLGGSQSESHSGSETGSKVDSDAISKYSVNNDNLVEYIIVPPSELGYLHKCSQLNFAKRLPMLEKMIEMHRETMYFPNYFCPQSYKIEFRPNGLSPHVLGNECAPGWPADILYILSQLLNKNMLAVQYGCGVSSIWLALYVNQLYAVDSRGDHVEDFQKKVGKTDLDLSVMIVLCVLIVFICCHCCRVVCNPVL